MIYIDLSTIIAFFHNRGAIGKEHTPGHAKTTITWQRATAATAKASQSQLSQSLVVFITEKEWELEILILFQGLCLHRRQRCLEPEEF